MGFNRRKILKTIGTTSVAASSLSLSAAAKSQSVADAFEDISDPSELPDPVPVTGKERGQLISRVKKDKETKKLLKTLKKDKWYPNFDSARLRTVGDNEYAVIPFQNNHAAKDEQAYLLWLKENRQKGDNLRVATYRILESEIITTQIKDGEISTHSTQSSDIEILADTQNVDSSGEVGTQDVLVPGGGSSDCDTCKVPISQCPWLDQNWYCFVDIVGYVLSTTAFFVGCGACAASLGVGQPACWACAGSLLRGTPLNLPCDKGFYTDCYVTDYRCVGEEYENDWC